jgi:hypothetical protein
MHPNKVALRGSWQPASLLPLLASDAGAEGATLTGSAPVSAAVFRRDQWSSAARTWLAHLAILYNLPQASLPWV